MANTAAGIVGGLVNLMSGVNTGAQAVMGITLPGLTGVPGNPRWQPMSSPAQQISPTDYLVDNNPDDVRQVNVDAIPTYYTEETNSFI